MITEIFTFSGFKNTELHAVVWMPESEPRMLLQITHGMTEHIGRYERFAQELTAHGIAVAGFDLRGHGKNPGDRQIASFGKEGWDASVEDMKKFAGVLKYRFPGIPHVMMGFSLGSFLLREYLGKYPEGIDGAIIMGTGAQPEVVLKMIMAVVNGQIKKAGFDQTTKLVRKLSFGTYNQKFRPNRTESDWLCSDIAQLDRYLADDLCRKDISSGLFCQLLDAMKRTGRETSYENWNKKLPVLLISGDKDPVGDFGKGVKAVQKQMEKAGLQKITMKLFPQARHMLLEEEDSGVAAKARAKILEWMLMEASV